CCPGLARRAPPAGPEDRSHQGGPHQVDLRLLGWQHRRPLGNYVRPAARLCRKVTEPSLLLPSRNARNRRNKRNQRNRPNRPNQPNRPNSRNRRNQPNQPPYPLPPTASRFSPFPSCPPFPLHSPLTTD